MDDINEKLKSLLDDPDSMEKVRLMAESILGEETSDDSSSNDIGLDPMTLSKIAGVMKRLNSGGDNRTKLLSSLRPLLSEERQKKVDTAIKLLRLIDILPYLKESGILNEIGF
ncbi:MAG: hypothetical protein IKF53_00110 [Clostridia bacterium]|nr:hypothetical protein [Clostridia bacterium]